MFWDGTRWVDERPAPRPRIHHPRRLVDTIATIPLVLLIPLLLTPLLAASAADPYLKVSGVAIPGGALSVSGAGWPTRTTLQLTWDGAAAQMPSVRTSPRGTFGSSITIPPTAKPTDHVLAVISKSNGGGRVAKITGTKTSMSQVLASVTVTVTADGSSPSDPPASTPKPTVKPTVRPTAIPAPTAATNPTADPTAGPSADPTAGPTADPTAPPDPTANPTPTPDPGPTLTFDAECNGSSLNSSLKALYTGGDPGYGLDSDFMGNLSQVSVANGYCTITAERANTPSGRAYASACLAPYGTFSQENGIFEARIRYPNGQGSWPAFWMLPAGQKGPYPEIDVFEAYPGDVNVGGPNLLVQTVHYGGEPSDFNLRTNMWEAINAGENLTGTFHTHKIVWTPSRVDFYLDGTKTFSVTSHVPQVRMYPIVSLAMGNYGYRTNASTPDRLKLDIDYLRVYSQ